ncbi:hypothetical protein LUZ61_008827 [Rhynchospora tenuis]|uniref:Uncharacterized protein n=1 Tax=Rhynchospora tenuis TaxID=198213 RepID=A0AAD5ZW39_9POAL|nr:hypothetical protein LUZ61_008827 [Rhynchospora tenuis]
MASGSNEYEVMIRSVETVVPMVQLQKHRLPLSNFDLLVPTVVHHYFCFQKPTLTTVTEDASAGFTTFPTMVAALKVALSKVLVMYYPLAGEVVTNSVGEQEILCNNRGVDLIEAYADVELTELNLYNPDDSVEAKLLPKNTEDPLHSDAYSFFMFMTAWANIVLNKPINQMPSFCRFLLSSQNISSSNSSDPIYDQFFTPLSLQSPPNPKISSETRVNHIYYISAVDIARLQELCGHSHSKLVCFIAYFWKILARSASRAKSLIDMTLTEVAEEVNKWLSAATKEDHFLGLVEWLEAHRLKPIVPTVFLGKEEDKSISCVVSSGRSFPEINFGWGNATFSSCHFPVREKGGYLFTIPQFNTGDWVVYAQLAPRIVAAMEKEPTIFRPLRSLDVYKSRSSRARL